MSVLSAETKKITELTATTTVGNNDMVIVELANGGTRKMLFSDLAAVLKDEVAKREKECIEGVRHIGNKINNIATLMGYVRAGQHDKYAIGDYFTDSHDVEWVIVARNFYPDWAFGDSSVPQNHIVCMPAETISSNYAYNPTDTNEGGYAGSQMPSIMETLFNNYLSGAIRNYCVQTKIYENNKGDWNAVWRYMRPGTVIEYTGSTGWADEYGNGVTAQLPMCRNAHFRCGSDNRYWAMDPSGKNNTSFCTIRKYGISHEAVASTSIGVRPLIVLA